MKLMLLSSFFFIFIVVQSQSTWVISGAPIGDTSVYLYPSGGWSSSDILSLQHISGEDSLKISNVSGTPKAIHIYRVDEAPNVKCGAIGIGGNDRYFGVFIVDGTSPTYDIDYFYAGNPYVNDENNLELRERNTNSDTVCSSWSNMSALLFSSSDSLYKSGVSGRKEILLVNTLIPLPIELLVFEGENKINHNLISWNTATEINNDFFTLEASKNAILWNEIAFQKGAGNSNKVKTYSFKDKDFYKNLTYYRLKQTDFDGSFAYSDIISVMSNREGNNIVIYPNTANNQLHIDFHNKDDFSMSVQIINNLGKVIKEVKIVNQKNKIDLSEISSGIYFIRLKENEEILLTRKIIKK